MYIYFGGDVSNVLNAIVTLENLNDIIAFLLSNKEINAKHHNVI